MELADDEQAAPRSRFRHLLEPVGRHQRARQQLHTARRRDGAVHERGLRQLRRHPGPAVPLGHLPSQPAGHGDVARVGVIRHGRSEYEVRISGRLPLRQSVRLHKRSVHGVPLQQRCAEPDHREHQRLPGQPARPLRRVLCTGPEDVRPHYAAGRSPLRSRVELLPRRDRRTGAVPPGGHQLRPRRTASMPTTTSRRAAAPPSTCSATARRR